MHKSLLQRSAIAGMFALLLVHTPAFAAKAGDDGAADVDSPNAAAEPAPANEQAPQANAASPADETTSNESAALRRLDAEYNDDANDSVPTDMALDPANVEYEWRVRNPPPPSRERPFIERRPATHNDGAELWGGKPVPRSGTPWLASIYWARTKPLGNGTFDWVNGHKCGGGLIDPEWIVTAAHCALDNSGKPLAPDELRVRIGAEDISDEQDGVDFRIDRIVMHAGYSTVARADKPNMFENDIALMHIVRDERTRQYDASEVAIARLSTQPAREDDLVTTLDWYRFIEDGTEHALLIKFEMTVPSRAECAEEPNHGEPWKLNDNVFCAEHPHRKMCSGDSGTPVLLAHGQRMIVGITSWATEVCSDANETGVYTQLAPYVDWIARAERNLDQRPFVELP